MPSALPKKKLFFNLRRLKGKINAIDGGDLKPEQVTYIVDTLDVTETEVISMNQRMSGGDKSLNTPMASDIDGGGEWQDWIEDNRENQETSFAEREEFEAQYSVMKNAIESLNSREQRIIKARRLTEPPLTLEELSEEFQVSRERIRQIEVRAFEKLTEAVKEKSAELNLLP